MHHTIMAVHLNITKTTDVKSEVSSPAEAVTREHQRGGGLRRSPSPYKGWFWRSQGDTIKSLAAFVGPFHSTCSEVEGDVVLPVG